MLYLREFKTSAPRGIYKRALHPKLTAEIQASLVQEPRQWLFQGKGNKPYTAKQLSKDPQKFVWQAFDFDRVAPLIPVQS